MRQVFFCILYLMAAMTWPCFAQERVERVTSPDGSLAIEVWTDQGRPFYRATLDGAPVVAASRLGLVLREAGGYDRDLQIVSATRAAVDSLWEQPWGERRFVRDHHQELLVGLGGANGEERLRLRFRAFDDGFGFRYEAPALGASTDATILDERTEFALLEAGAKAWWIPGSRWNRYEYLYQSTDFSAIERAHTPMTARLGNGVYVSLHEAALTDYAGMALDQKRGGVFKAELTPWSDGVRVKTQFPFHSPWRTVQIGRQAIDLLNSDLILNLNEPNKLGNVDWVEPGKYVGIWWEMHIREGAWSIGPHHSATTENTKKYIDFAARHGFNGVLVEGWNTGWEKDWFANGAVFDFLTPYPDFDLRGLAAYALSKGVRLIGHHETGAASSFYETQMERAFDLYQELGVRTVKTGYVADAGGVQRVDPDGRQFDEWHDGQFQVRHHQRVVEAAAKRQISINPHEPVKDTGLRRTYPNLVSREGARGQEFNAWGVPPNPPEHETILPFTRLLSGPMDFTPGIFDLHPNRRAPIAADLPRNSPLSRVQTTLAKQLALYVVIYSPIQMAADLPENYEKRMDAFQFIKDVPTDWETSRALAGEPVEYVAIARQRRSGQDWYVGLVTDEQARDLTLDCAFLTPGIRYVAEIYRDDPQAHWDSNPDAVRIERRTISSSDQLRIWLAPGGGAAIRLTPMPAP